MTPPREYLVLILGRSEGLVEKSYEAVEGCEWRDPESCSEVVISRTWRALLASKKGHSRAYRQA